MGLEIVANCIAVNALPSKVDTMYSRNRSNGQHFLNFPTNERTNEWVRSAQKDIEIFSICCITFHSTPQNGCITFHTTPQNGCQVNASLLILTFHCQALLQLSELYRLQQPNL